MQIKLWPQNAERLKELAKTTMRSPTIEGNILLEEFLPPKPKRNKKNGSRRP